MKFLITFRDGEQDEYDAQNWKFLLLALPIYYGEKSEEINSIEVCKWGDCSQLKND
jgi:hypothetical protein